MLEDSPNSDSSSKSDSDEYEDSHSYENPNYRKLYAALSVKKMMGNKEDGLARSNNIEDCELDEGDLPPGWEKHEDDNGPYYWHIPTGTIQRDKPTQTVSNNSFVYYQEGEEGALNGASDKLKNLGNTFIVNSLGWTEFDEQNLTRNLSSQAVQKCIVEVTTRGDNNAVRCWGKETQKLLLRIENSSIKLFDITSNTLLKCQPISAVHVWGVNENDDFVYVASDSDSSSKSSQLKCYVFHCEENAGQKIATFLRDEMIRLKLNNEMPNSNSNKQNRPQNLFIEPSISLQSISLSALEFPTPIEEPRKTISAKYMGRISVSKPMGIDVLNEAIENILLNIAKHEKPTGTEATLDENFDVFVHVSPSTIIVESASTSEYLVECRVRFVSIQLFDIKSFLNLLLGIYPLWE